jgi:2-polyprenyl-6-methoxyphenol hydroxylase-like FAD-dependent oxidoreductase
MHETVTHSTMAHEHVPVLIVGAGGAGLSMLLLLRQQGIASMVIERRRDISWVPRARNLNFRTLEAFRGLQLGKEVHAAGMHHSRIFRKPSLASPEEEELVIPQLEPSGLEKISPEPFYLYCPQNRLEPVLRAAATERGCDVRYGTELISFAQEETGGTATVKERDGDRSYVVKADYLIAADGTHSHIRESLGIRSEGHGALPEYFIFIYFRATWQRLIAGHEADAIQIPDAGGFFLVAKDDLGMFVITYRPALGESFEEFTVERCQALVEKAIGQPGMAVEILDTVRFQLYESVAEQFRGGRVFLVGDAAHTMPGYKGLGLNTAVQSAQNLAWKLAAVIRGQAGPELLATYQAERHPVGQFAAHQSLTGPGAAAVVPKGTINRLLPEKEDLPLFYPIVGYRYRSRAIYSEEPAEAGQGEIALLDREELDGRPGTRVPHLWLERQGRRISTLDLLDGRFDLLAGPDGTPWHEAAPRAAASAGIDLAAYRVGPDGDVLDLENGWPTKMGLPAQGAVLVRPDGFVAWRTSTPSSSPERRLVEVLSSVLCRSGPSSPP